MSTLGALACRRLVELVTGYLDTALTAAEHARFLDHIAACPNCATSIDQVRSTTAVAGQITAESAEDALRPGGDRGATQRVSRLASPHLNTALIERKS